MSAMPSPWPMRWAGAFVITAIINIIINTVFPAIPIWVVLLVELISAAVVLLTPLVLNVARDRNARSNTHRPESGQ